MKNSKQSMALSGLLLIAGFTLPVSQVLAEECCDVSPVTNAVNNLNTQNQSSLSNIRAIVEQHYNLDEQDVSRKEAANAIINYEAEARLKEFEYNQQLMFMNAPGVNWAILAGQSILEFDLPGRIDALVSASFSNAMGEFFPTEDQYSAIEEATGQDLRSGGVPSGNVPSPKELLLKELLEAYAEAEGDENANPTDTMNLSQALRRESLEEDTAKTYLNLISDPDLKINFEVADKLKNPEKKLTPAEQEAIMNKLVDAINMGPSTNLMAGILARRLMPTPAEGEDPDPDAKSYMQSLEKHVNERFTTEEWYGEVGAASEAALLKELNHMFALFVWMMHQSYKLQEQEAAVLATLNANFSRMYRVMKDMSETMEKEAQEAKKEAAKAKEEFEDLDMDELQEEAEAQAAEIEAAE